MNTQRIIYQLPGQPISIVIPANCGMSVQEIGCKDVPSGVPFWIVDVTKIPLDRTFRDAWELDPDALGVPNGYGSTN